MECSLHSLSAVSTDTSKLWLELGASALRNAPDLPKFPCTYGRLRTKRRRNCKSSSYLQFARVFFVDERLLNFRIADHKASDNPGINSLSDAKRTPSAPTSTDSRLYVRVARETPPALCD